MSSRKRGKGGEGEEGHTRVRGIPSISQHKDLVQMRRKGKTAENKETEMLNEKKDGSEGRERGREREMDEDG